MLTARPADVVHATMTDHLIRRSKPREDLTAPREEQSRRAGADRDRALFPERVRSRDEFLTYRGFGSARSLRPGQVLEWIEAFRKTGPHPVAGYVNLARGLLEIREARHARILLDEGVRRFPTSAEAQWMHGIALRAEGHAEAGLAALQNAKRLAPQHPGILATLADAYLQREDYAAARAEYEAALGRRRNNWQSTRSYAFALQRSTEPTWPNEPTGKRSPSTRTTATRTGRWPSSPRSGRISPRSCGCCSAAPRGSPHCSST